MKKKFAIPIKFLCGVRDDYDKLQNVKSLMAFIKRLVTSKVAHLFVVAHLISIVFLYSWAQGKEITSHNFYYQPILLKVFTVINFPPIFLTGVIFAPFAKTFPEQSSAWVEGSYFFVLIFLSFLQWLLVGYIISKVKKK